MEIDMEKCHNKDCNHHTGAIDNSCMLHFDITICQDRITSNSDSSDKPSDIQIGGDHYSKMKIQPFEFITKNELSFAQGNVIKYICRYKHKNGKQDLEKVKHYVDLLIEQEYPDEI